MIIIILLALITLQKKHLRKSLYYKKYRNRDLNHTGKLRGNKMATHTYKKARMSFPKRPYARRVRV